MQWGYSCGITTFNILGMVMRHYHREVYFMEDTNTNIQPEATGTEEQKESKTYSQEEFDKALESAVDKRIQQAMEKAQRKADARVEEAKKLAKMSEEQKFQYELDQREKAIAEKEQALALAENKAEAAKVLADKGISVKLVDFVLAADAETMLSNISLLEKEFKASVKAEVERRLQTSTPKKNLPPDQAITKESFSKMKLSEQAELFRTNPELYKTLVRK